ncbi:class I SAM-dependent methyltransferase [bacterium]|nr:class I SAM-dependent methyltransferase [bacterium]
MIGDNIEKQFNRFKKFISEIDQTNLSEYKEKFFQQINSIAKTIESAPNRTELEDHFFEMCGGIETSIMHKRTRKKPLGYAGDYQLIDWIYTKKTAPSGKGKLFDLLFHSYEAAESVRNRKAYFIQKCIELSRQKQSRFDILNIGCGSCRDVLEMYQYSKNGKQIYFHCVDHEKKALQYAKKLFANTQLRENIHLDNENIFKLKTSKKYDMIWSAGLFDYLEDPMAILLLKKIWRYLKEDGQIIFGNFSTKNPTRKGMEMVGKWHLIHRTADHLIKLCKKTHLPFSEIEIESEPLGVNLFCILRK